MSLLSIKVEINKGNVLDVELGKMIVLANKLGIDVYTDVCHRRIESLTTRVLVHPEDSLNDVKDRVLKEEVKKLHELNLKALAEKANNSAN
tara:strand:+ start:392 stop:664 length:273 start_codon:yes stop_codon:yes gene_type:complete